MKKYDLVVLGLGKTGTTSIFEMLSNHPEICVSKIKEAITKLKSEASNLYLERYFVGINEDTKVLLDGTPSPYITSEKIETLSNILDHKWVGKLKVIYSIRNPIDRMISQMLKVV